MDLYELPRYNLKSSLDKATGETKHQSK